MEDAKKETIEVPIAAEQKQEPATFKIPPERTPSINANRVAEQQRIAAANQEITALQSRLESEALTEEEQESIKIQIGAIIESIPDDSQDWQPGGIKLASNSNESLC